MSKKMWQKIFKSKAQKQQQQQQQLNKINKRHSRGIYEEYQQLSELLNGEKSPAARFSTENENENSRSCSSGSSSSSSGCGSGNINVFEQQPLQSSFNSMAISEAQQRQQQQQQSPQLSTFSRVRNTFSLRRNSNNNNNNKSSNNNLNSSSQKQSPNAKSSESDTPTPTPTAAGGGQLQHVLIIVNQIDVAAVATATTTTNTATNSAQPLHAKPATTPTTTTTATTTRSTKMENNDVEDDPPVGPPPGPLTTGLSQTILESGAVSTELTPCPNCGRTFNPNALRKHINVCEKMKMKKRKVFDSSRQRREGTSLSTHVLPKNFGLPNAEKAPGVHTPPPGSREASTVQEDTPLPARRKNKESSRTTLRKGGGTTASTAPAAADPAPAAAAPAAVASAAAAAASPAAPSAASRPRASVSITRRIKETASERCPHCDRSFNPKAYDRHVEWCKEKAIQANMKASNTAETNKAKERMEARKQYRPPNLKTKRAINRDKYSGAQEEQYEPEIVSLKQNPTLSAMTTSVQSDNPQRSAPPQRPGTPDLHQEHRQPRGNPRQQDMENAGELVRHGSGDAMQVAQLDCAEAAPLQPARARRSSNQRQKVEVAESMMAGSPQVTMTFEELNGLIKRQGGAKICNIRMDLEEQELNIPSKIKSSTKLARTARRRENPSIPLRSLPAAESDCDLVDDDQAAYSGSDDEEMSSHIKVDTHAMRTISRPKKRAQLPAISSAEPMRALPMPENPQRLEQANQNFLPSIHKVKAHHKGNHDDDFEDEDNEEDHDEADKKVDKLLRKEKLLENKLDDGAMSSDIDEKEKELKRQPKQVPTPLLRSSTNLSRHRTLPQQAKERSSRTRATPYPTVAIKKEKSPSRSSSRTLLSSGHNALASDKYDPFLSAKRQLEELCSPNTPPDNEPPPLMSTSLTSSLGKSNATTPTATATGTPTATAPRTTTSTTSNFRRTSSLRAPRRTPLLPSRPLFATNYRPTIQRGLSDEGPISSNFLKPEEYDEMPVRAACVNDFHSPRVVRRDTSASNRKQQLALPLGGASEAENGTSAASKQTTPAPARNVAKTDSLAVFLKYEHELEQLSSKTATEVDANASKELSIKELKDKSNNLSKQNSAKNLTANANSGQLPPLTTPMFPSAPKENNENVAHNFATPLRLEPIGKPVPSLISLNNINNNNCSSSSSSSNDDNNNNKNSGNAAPLPIKLETIFGNSRLGDYIDPKLINPCDNLHVQQQSSTGSSDTSSTPQQLPQSRSSSQSTITVMGQEQRRHSGEARNLLKRKMRLGRNQFLYDASPEEAYISSGSCADDEANRSSLEFDEQCWQQQQKQLLSNPLKAMPALPAMPNMPVLPTFDDFDFEEFLSSFEHENDDEQFPLFRDCREFLLNRSTSRQRSFQKATSTPQTPAQSQTQTAPTTAPTQATKTTPTATQRPATTGTSTQFITPPKIHYYDPPARRSDSNVSASSDSLKSTHCSSSSYKTPNSGSCKSPHSSYKTSVSSSDEKLQRQQSNVSSSSRRVNSEKVQKPAEDSQKREIFISIETETNAQGRSPISPDSLRHMVGNAQTPINVLHIENGNEPEHAKFSKISDNEEQPDADDRGHGRYRKRADSSGSIERPSQSPRPTLNVEANNAKNVIEKLRNDFNQLAMETGASIRLDTKQRQEQLQHKQQMPPPSLDSDELNSLDSYTMFSSQSSCQGAKPSTDSAYGSSNSPYFLTHQKSSEQQANSNAPRSQSQMRPHTASGALSMSMKQAGSMIDASTQAQTNYGTLKARQQMFPNSFGGGDSLETQPQVAYSNNNYELNALNLKNNNNSQHSLQSDNSNTSSTMSSSSMKMSKFCHECGTKFVIEHAKFCMDCGVRRVVL